MAPGPPLPVHAQAHSELEARDRDRHVHRRNVVAVASLFGERQRSARVAGGLFQVPQRPQGGGSRAERPREKRRGLGRAESQSGVETLELAPGS